ncbi:MAG: acyltransferase [Gemmatimonadaceae bacterium]
MSSSNSTASSTPVGGVRGLVLGGLRELYARPAGQLAGLDALRSAAILLVIGTHWALPEYQAAGGVPTALQQFPLFYYGWTGVDLFFVLSGYLIGRQLWRELQRTGTVQLGVFLLRRGLRIWPLYFFMLLYFAAGSRFVHPRLADWVFLSNYFPGGMVRGWSLSTEEQFYIAVPLLILLLKRRIPLQAYAWILLAIEGVLLVVRRAKLTTFFAAGGVYERADYVLIYPFHTHLEGLLIGLIIALLSVTHAQWFEKRSVSGISWIGLGVVLSSMIAAFALRSADRRLFAFVSLGLLYGGFVFFVLADRSWITRPLGAWIFYPISRLSYGMYLNHWWFSNTANSWMVDTARRITADPTAVFLITLVMGTIASIGFAVCTFVIIEHPFLVMRDRWMAQRKERASGELSSSLLPKRKGVA